MMSVNCPVVCMLIVRKVPRKKMPISRYRRFKVRCGAGSAGNRNTCDLDSETPVLTHALRDSASSYEITSHADANID